MISDIFRQDSHGRLIQSSRTITLQSADLFGQDGHDILSIQALSLWLIHSGRTGAGG
jgi:hypothetical protein